MSALRKNVASQVLTFNLVNATSGAALTGASVTTKVALDGTQSAGTGTVTELGTGQYKYVPTQGETNGASAGFSFTATNAVPVNLHCFTIGQDPALATLDANVTKWLGTAASTPTVAGVPNVNVKTWNDLTTVALPATPTNITAGTITTVTNLTNAPTAGDLTATMKTSVTTAATAATPTAAAVTGSIGSVGAGGITAASLASDAITAAKIADGAIDAATFAAGAINAAAIAADAITDAKVASDVTIASVTGAVGSVTGNVGGNVVGSVASVTAGVTLAASAVQAIWDALTSALTTVGSIGKLLVDNINATISSRLPTASYVAPLDAAGTRSAVGLASANLDTQLGDLPTNAELATSQAAADDATLAAIAALPTAAGIADAVWEEALADHSGTAGSTAEALGAAGSAGDPWTTALPGAYTSGQAGKILGDNLNATVSSRATQTSVDDVPTNAELATSQAAADDATLAAIAALNNVSAAQVNAEVDTALADYDGPTRAEATSDANSILSKLLKYFQLAFRKDAAIATDNATEVTAINADGGTGPGAFANTTDALEALRDRGDAVWADSGTPPSAAAIATQVRTELTTELGRLDVATSTRATPAQVNTEADTAIADAALATAANLATLAGYVDTEVAAIKVKTDQLTFTVANQIDANVLDWKSATAPAMTGDAFARLGAPAGASVSADLAAIEAQTDDIGAAGAGLTAVPWNSAWDAEVQSEVQDAIEVNHLDHLFAVTYDPASKPGVADALLNELVESDAGVARYTANALEQAPTGGSAPTAAAIADAVWEEAIADHSGTVGSTAEALGAAGSAGDPWVTALPGAYGAGSAGKIVGDNINATISSRSTLTAAQVWDVLVSGLTTVGSIGKRLVDNIDAAISSRSTYAGGDTAGTTTLLSRLSAARAGYLDNLSAGAAALEASVQSLITTVGVAGAGLTATASAVWSVATRVLTAGTNIVLAKGTGLTGLNDISAADVWAAGTRTLTSFGTVVADTATAVWAAGTRVLTAGTNIVLAKGTGLTGLNDLSAAQVNAEADTALADVGVTGTVTGRIDAAISTRATPAQVNTEADLALSDVGLTTVITGRIDVAVSTRATPAQVNAEVVDALVTDTYAEPSAVPAATASLKDKIGWQAALARNKVTQDATEQALRNDADNADIATAAVSDTGTVFTRNEWV